MSHQSEAVVSFRSPRELLQRVDALRGRIVPGKHVSRGSVLRAGVLRFVLELESNPLAAPPDGVKVTV